MALEEWNPAHQDAFILALTQHATLHMRDPKKELDKARVRIYWKVLRDFDIGVIVKACDDLLGEMSSFPKPKHIKDRCLRVLAGRARAQRVNAERRPGIVCDDCRDGGWRYHRWESKAPVSFDEMQEEESRVPALRVGETRPTPRFFAKPCPCRRSNPNYQAHAADDLAGRDAPFDAAAEAEYLTKKYLPRGAGKAMPQRGLLDGGEE